MKKDYFIISIMVITIILLGIIYVLDKIERERCYNMPINRYVEDKSCEKYTWEDYMKDNKYD